MPTNDWAPQRRVHLSAFYIDKFEVTWARYRKCVEAGVCSRRGLNTLPATKAALFDPASANRPAFGIRFQEARIFCLWDGKRLPTEADWERAARGTEGRDYPWGNSPPSKELLSAPTYYDPDGARVPDVVGSHPEDVTPEGVADLFGGVEEWVADWYSPTAFADASTTDPNGPASPVFVRFPHEYGEGNFVASHGTRSLRGDPFNRSAGRAWEGRPPGAPVWLRDQRDPAMGAGFRCARDDRPPTEFTRKGFGLYEGIVGHPVSRGGSR